MSAKRSFLSTWLYTVLRLTPVAAALFVLDLSAVTPDEYALRLNRLLRLLVVLIVWSMIEGVSMLWIREKNAQSPNARGYGAVTLIGAFIVLIFLQVFRTQATQGQFLLLLTALGLRGMTRSGWEQGRPYVSIVTAIAAHSLVAALSFLLTLGSLPWQTVLVSGAFGSLLGALESTWNGASFSGVTRKWIMPLYRVSLVFSCVAIGSLGLVSGLPRIYMASFLLLVPALRVLKATSTEQAISPSRFALVAGLYVAFLAIMGACRAYT